MIRNMKDNYHNFNTTLRYNNTKLVIDKPYFKLSCNTY